MLWLTDSNERDAILLKRQFLPWPSGPPTLFQAFLQTPRLNLYSPDPGCGKTTALDIIASMVPRPLRTENLTAPVLFRLVDQHQPTLLLDEVDAYLPQAEELRGLLNAGHKEFAEVAPPARVRHPTRRHSFRLSAALQRVISRARGASSETARIYRIF